jgi:hypothetical protein
MLAWLAFAAACGNQDEAVVRFEPAKEAVAERPAPPPPRVAISWTGGAVHPLSEERRLLREQLEPLLEAKDWEALDTIAREAASSEERSVGGSSLLWEYYRSLWRILSVADEDREKENVELLRAWKRALPESVAPRALLAEL